jgi:O-antigen ligase
LIGLLAVGLGGGAVALALFRSQAVALDRLIAGGEEVRAERLGTLFDMAWAFMPFGSGLGTFTPAYLRFEPDDQLKLSYANQAHNEPAQLLIEGGLAGGALLLLLVGWWAWRSIAIWRPSASGSEATAARAGSVVLGIALLASLADYPLRTPLFAGIAIIAAVLMGARRSVSVASPAKFT